MMELVQTLHHRWFGTYLAYARPGLMRHARAMLPVALVNKSVAQAFLNLIKSPVDWFAPAAPAVPQHHPALRRDGGRPAEHV